MNDKLHYRKSWLWLGIIVVACTALGLWNYSNQDLSVPTLALFLIALCPVLWLAWDQTIDRDYDTFQELKNGNIAFAIYKLLIPLACIAGAIASQG